MRSRSSSASSTAVLSAPKATSTTSEKPSSLIAVTSCPKLASNCPAIAGATSAYICLRLSRARTISTIWLRSSTAPKGQAATQQPQLIHFAWSMEATPFSSFCIAFVGQLSSQGTAILAIAW